MADSNKELANRFPKRIKRSTSLDKWGFAIGVHFSNLFAETEFQMKMKRRMRIPNSPKSFQCALLEFIRGNKELQMKIKRRTGIPNEPKSYQCALLDFHRI